MKDIDIQKELSSDNIKLLISGMQRRLEKIYLGGGDKKIQKMKSENRLPARERVALLLDKDRPSIEIGAFAGYEMYPEHGGCPAGGVIIFMGYVHNRIVLVVANDPTVKAGAWFPITGKKNLRGQEISMENHLPIIYLVDSAGVFSFPCKMKYFPIKSILGEFLEIMPKCRPWGFLKSPLLWVVALPEEPIFPL
jgi:3-methylcrotonyl-CoA carboxylase beta subunit